MKKFTSILLAMFICLASIVMTTSASSSPFPPGSIKSATIVTENSMLHSSAEATKLVTELFSNGKKSAGTPEKPVTIANLVVTLSDSTTASYLVVTSTTAPDSLYLQGDKSLHEISKTIWDEQVKALVPSSEYAYSNIPAVSHKTGIPAVIKSTYAYKKLDSVYYRIQLKGAPTLSEIASTELNGFQGYGDTPVKDIDASFREVSGTKALWEGKLSEISKFHPAKIGTYTLSFTSHYKNALYRGDVTQEINVKYATTAFIPDGASEDIGSTTIFSIEGGDNYLGELAVLTASNVPKGHTVTMSSKDIDFAANFFDIGGNEQVALLPLNYRQSPGDKKVTLSVGDISKEFTILVKDKTFQIQQLTADTTTTGETLLNKEANEEYEKYIAPIRPVADKNIYWQGHDFIWPLKQSRVTTQFGMKRYVNGAPTTYRHGAIDMAAPLGTRVSATNNGKVLYSGYLKLTGNTIVIEHGLGLKSWYYHMDSRTVKTGDTVTVGQAIGTVGSTGFSTGPHLHFGFSVNNVFVNPSTIIQTDILDIKE